MERNHKKVGKTEVFKNVHEANKSTIERFRQYTPEELNRSVRNDDPIYTAVYMVDEKDYKMVTNDDYNGGKSIEEYAIHREDLFNSRYVFRKENLEELRNLVIENLGNDYCLAIYIKNGNINYEFEKHAPQKEGLTERALLVDMKEFEYIAKRILKENEMEMEELELYPDVLDSKLLELLNEWLGEYSYLARI